MGDLLFADTTALWHLDDCPLDLSLPDGTTVVTLRAICADHLGRLPGVMSRRVTVEKCPVGTSPLIQSGHLALWAGEDVPTESMLIWVEAEIRFEWSLAVVHIQCPGLLIFVHAILDIFPEMRDIHRHGPDLDAECVAVTAQLLGPIHGVRIDPVAPSRSAALSATPVVVAQIDLVLFAGPATRNEVDALPMRLGFPVALGVGDLLRTAEWLPRVCVPLTATATFTVGYRFRPARTYLGLGRAPRRLVQLDALACPLAETFACLGDLAAVVGSPAELTDLVLARFRVDVVIVRGQGYLVRAAPNSLSAESEQICGGRSPLAEVCVWNVGERAAECLVLAGFLAAGLDHTAERARAVASAV